MNDIPALKQQIKQFKEQLCYEFYQHRSIRIITRKLVQKMDEVLIALFQKNNLHDQQYFCLLALGSYGRRELQLYSDIDILLLHHEETPISILQRAQSFLQNCWDIGLEISHQITTVNACAMLASQNLSVMSSILDMHLLCGNHSLLEELSYQTHPLHMWPSHDYFFAKWQEQQQRYDKYDETADNLEPNIKFGPGGLRDLQVLLTIAKRQFNIKKLADGINCGFLTDKEYDELMHCQYFLWNVRFALHACNDKRVDRLLFDNQIQLAALFGYQDTPQSLAIEQFMKTCFTVMKRVRELNEMLLQWFAEMILHEQKQTLIRLDEDFQLSNHDIEIHHAKVFSQNPHALLQLFLWVTRYPQVTGVRASTIRAIRQNLYLLTRQVRTSKMATSIFMAILRTPNDPSVALQWMSRFGVLGHYLDCFAAITGQMQYDLFHVYTVDQHTLFVIRNLARFKQDKYQKQFPLCCQIMATIRQPEILYLAALFHDIAKGRGGDHSELGAEEAAQFAQLHQLSPEDSTLLVWLVRHHLLMSQTAQRQDIYAPKTIQQFCNALPEQRYLDYLYLLTVADICGTNPNLWNGWKDSLLKELYFATQQAFLQEQRQFDETILIQDRRKKALSKLMHDKPLWSQDTIEALWAQFKGRYFLHESPDMIAIHTKAILECQQFPLVLIMPHHSQGGTEIFIYMPHCDERFIITTTVLSNYRATIQEAMILTCHNQFDLDTYVILDEHHRAYDDERQMRVIQKALMMQLAAPLTTPVLKSRRLTRTQAHFKRQPQITFSQDQQAQFTRLFLITNDRPGLLANISRILFHEHIHLHNAKIATAGERVEDMFDLTNQAGAPLTAAEETRLRQRLLRELQSVD